MQRTQNSKTSDPSQILSAYGNKQKIQKYFNGTGRTKQSFKAECDINQILARYLKTGVLEHLQKHEARYGDVTGIEYQSAMQLVAGAQTMFNELPSRIRDRFNNDPSEFLAFVSDKNNIEEARELGLASPQPPETSGDIPQPIPPRPKPAKAPQAASEPPADTAKGAPGA